MVNKREVKKLIQRLNEEETNILPGFRTEDESRTRTGVKPTGV